MLPLRIGFGSQGKRLRAGAAAPRPRRRWLSTEGQGGKEGGGSGPVGITASFPKGGACLKAGDWAELRRSFSDADIRSFACVSMDDNTIHLDDNAAAASIFGRRDAHGMLSACAFSVCCGPHIPGSVNLNQTVGGS